ncbi:MAG: hypothetical protein K6E62_13250 [Lachnospiraceae bacterium]|nr:hypothetical protein [Lachnospiraceae bacterium]
MENGLTYSNYIFDNNNNTDPEAIPDDWGMIEEGIMKESKRVVFTMLDNGCPPEKISYLCGYSREFVEKMIRRWDPDFTKLSATERLALGKIEEEMRSGEYITADQINLQLRKE